MTCGSCPAAAEASGAGDGSSATKAGLAVDPGVLRRARSPLPLSRSDAGFEDKHNVEFVVSASGIDLQELNDLFQKVRLEGTSPPPPSPLRPHNKIAVPARAGCYPSLELHAGAAKSGGAFGAGLFAACMMKQAIPRTESGRTRLWTRIFHGLCQMQIDAAPANPVIASSSRQQ